MHLPIEAGTMVPIKGASFTVAGLLGDGAAAEALHGGDCLVFRLAPVDYHRFAYVDEGHHEGQRRIPGRLHAVNPIALWKGVRAFQDNTRDVVVLETAHFGTVVHVDVGAIAVGRIVQHYREPHHFQRGQEKGYFEFGGSTTVLLFEPGAVILDDDVREYSARGIEVLVRYGARIGRRAQGGPSGSG